MMSLQYLAPNIAIELRKYGYSHEIIGFSIGIPAVLYASICPFVYLITARMQKRGVMLIGYIIVTIGMLMIGGSDMLTLFDFKGHPTFIFVGLMLLGLSGGLISIPILPEMVETYEQDENLTMMYDKKQVEILISGLFVSISSWGSMLGPVLASNLAHYFSFRTA